MLKNIVEVRKDVRESKTGKSYEVLVIVFQTANGQMYDLENFLTKEQSFILSTLIK